MTKADIELLSLLSSKPQYPSQTTILATILEKQFRTLIFLSICKPCDPQLNNKFTTQCGLPWIYCITDHPSIPESTFCKFGRISVKQVFMQLQSGHQSLLGKKKSEKSIMLVSTFHQHCELLSQYSESSLLELILCYRPFTIQFPSSQELMISDVLRYEFEDIVHQFLN